MNYQEWTQRKFWIVMGCVLLTGIIISPKGVDSEVADANVQAVAAEAVEEVRSSGAKTLSRLDAIDQQIFEHSGEVIDAQANALSIAGDILTRSETITVDEIDAATAEVNQEKIRIDNATTDIERLRTEREAVLAN